MKPKFWRIGIDLGGTKIEGVLMNPHFKEVNRIRVATCQSEGYAAILNRIYKLVGRLRVDARGVPVAIGVGTPGMLSKRTALLKNSNTQCLNKKPIKSDLEKMLGQSIRLENDANCFAFAEAQHGAGKGYPVVFGVIMGTGCGGGLVVNGKLWSGPQGIAGEWGHMAIDPRGPRCYCGSRGCVETLISGGGLQNRYFAITQKRKSVEAIFRLYRSGDKAATRCIKRFFSDFGRSLANLIHVLDPDCVILGGGLSNIADLYEVGIERIRECLFSDELTTVIAKNSLGDSAGVIGAALLAKPND